jgi:hypothetical protein
MDRNYVNANSDPNFRVDANTDSDWHPHVVSTQSVHMLINQIFCFLFVAALLVYNVLSFSLVSKVS